MNQHQKCIWTGTRDPRVIAITLKTLDNFTAPTEKTFHVLPEYEQNLRRFNEKFVKWGRKFMTLIFGLILLLPVSVIIALIFSVSDSIILYAVGVIISLFGLALVLFPFATPETVTWMGLKKSILAV
jgi:archaellum biogenesis protein FlaJ (TadC family)